MLLAGDFVSTFFPIARTVLVVIMALSALALIICAVMQSTDNDQSMNALTGQESYYSQNKGESRDYKLKKATVITSIIVAVCCILYFVSLLINASV